MFDATQIVISLLSGIAAGGGGASMILGSAQAKTLEAMSIAHRSAIETLTVQNQLAIEAARAMTKTQSDAAIESATALIKAQSEAALESTKAVLVEAAAKSSRNERDDLLALANAQSNRAMEAFRAQSEAIIESAKVSLLESAAKSSRGDRDELVNLATAQMTPILEPIARRIEELNRFVAETDQQRAGGYSALAAVMDAIMKQNQTLGEATALMSSKTDALVGALRGSQARGRWGEVKLRNIIESAGMTAWCDFIEQTSTHTDGQGRPDITVRIPGNKVVFVDSKVPMIAHEEAQDVRDEQRAAELRRDHARLVKGHVDELARRGYHRAENSMDFTLMFLPTEPLLLTALAEMPELWEYAMGRGIMICSPMMILPVLRMFASDWRSQQQDEQAREIARLGGELYKRLSKFVSLFNALGQTVATLNTRYNEAAGSLSARLLPQAQRVHKAAALAEAEISDPVLIDAAPRQIALTESDAA